jgi:hypothetical protein
MEDQVKEQYHEWMSLLIKTKNTDLLRDPYNVWLEAWHVATLFAEKKTPVLDGGKTTN